MKPVRRVKHSRKYQYKGKAYRRRSRKELYDTYKYACGTMAAVLLCIAAMGIICTITLNSRAAQSRQQAEITDFPESYQAGLTAVKKAIPNAVFIKFNTGIKWSDMFTSDNLMYFSRQLIPNTSAYPSSWKDTSYHAGSFDWKNNDWVVLSAPSWVQASEEIVAYYVDPRNFLTEQGIFMFEQQSFDSSIHTQAGTDAVLVNTFMHSSAGNKIEVTKNGTTKQYTYAQLLYEIGQELDVSPYLLATRLRQEQGSGTSELISGTVAGYEGYYNYFNIGASGETREEIVTNGMKEAVAEGWNSRYKAIYGGAQKLVSNYISTGRDTLYLQKFNLIENAYGQIPYYGYMQNLLAPSSESTNVYNSYSASGMLTTGSFVFVIPVFTDMPQTASAMPTKDGNPNNRASAIQIDSGTYSIGTFDMDTLYYSTVVPYETDSVKISVSLYAATSKVALSGKTIGSTGTKTRSGTVSLTVGNNTVPIVITAENGDTRLYTLTIRRQSADETQVTGAPEISSTKYNITSGGNISKITVGTSAKTFLSGITVKNGSLKLVTSSGGSVSDSAVMATGMKLQVLNGSKQVYKTYTIIIYGDANGDGEITARDMLALKRHILEITALTGSGLTAADVNNDGSVTARDMLEIKRDILNIKSLEQR